MQIAHMIIKQVILSYASQYTARGPHATCRDVSGGHRHQRSRTMPRARTARHATAHALPDQRPRSRLHASNPCASLAPGRYSARAANRCAWAPCGAHAFCLLRCPARARVGSNGSCTSGRGSNRRRTGSWSATKRSMGAAKIRFLRAPGGRWWRFDLRSALTRRPESSD